jgi:membrane protease YdiL (CAAX protease family)
VSPSLLIFTSGTLALTVIIAWLTYRSGQVLRQMEVPFNLLLAPAENAVRLVGIGVCLALGAASGLRAHQLGWTVTDPAGDLAWGAGLGLVGAWLLHPLIRWAIARFGPQVYSTVVIRNILPRNRREWLLVALAFGPAALLEELLFRSLLLGGFSVFLPPLWLAVAGATVFGLMHRPQGSLGVAVTDGLGLGLAWLFLWRGSLLAPLAAHYVINVVQLLRVHQDRDWLERVNLLIADCGLRNPYQGRAWPFLSCLWYNWIVSTCCRGSNR